MIIVMKNITVILKINQTAGLMTSPLNVKGVFVIITLHDNG